METPGGPRPPNDRRRYAAGEVFEQRVPAEIMHVRGRAINYTGLWRDVAGYCLSPDADALNYP